MASEMECVRRDERRAVAWPCNEPRFGLPRCPVNPNSQCWCGSGKRYAECHRTGDMLTAEAELRANLEAKSLLIRTSFFERTNIETLFRFHSDQRYLRL